IWNLGFLGSWCFAFVPVESSENRAAAFFGTTGTMLDIIMGISACEREHAEHQMKLLEAQGATGMDVLEDSSTDP
ncbi:hypothetical protein Leryth_009758, partial [Lithospermum erythrorhizon]